MLSVGSFRWVGGGVEDAGGAGGGVGSDNLCRDSCTLILCSRRISAARVFSSSNNPSSRCSVPMWRCFKALVSSAAYLRTLFNALLSGNSTEVDVLGRRGILVRIRSRIFHGSSI